MQRSLTDRVRAIYVPALTLAALAVMCIIDHAAIVHRECAQRLRYTFQHELKLLVPA